MQEQAIAFGRICCSAREKSFSRAIVRFTWAVVHGHPDRTRGACRRSRHQKRADRYAWPNTVVEENNLRVHVTAIRKILGDGQANARYIVNVTGRGYSFVAPVTRVEARILRRGSGSEDIQHTPRLAHAYCRSRRGHRGRGRAGAGPTPRLDHRPWRSWKNDCGACGRPATRKTLSTSLFRDLSVIEDVAWWPPPSPPPSASPR